VPLPASLRREGDMMLGALVKDLAEIPGWDPVLTRDRRLPHPDLPGADLSARIEWLDDGDPWPAWRRIVEEVDAVWPIAPETGSALARLSDLVLAAGRTLIGSRPDAVRLTTDKRATAECLAAAGVPVAPTRPLSAIGAIDPPAGPNGWVVKPVDGAGAEDTYLFRRREDLACWLERAGAEAGRFVLQPYLSGTAASLSMLCREGRAWLLSCNRQEVAVLDDGRFAYRGGLVGGMEHRRPAYEPIADAVAAAIPGLWGYVGVDLVDGSDGPVILEVNPRLTTSFVGLREAIGRNPAALVLDLLEREIDAIRCPLRPEPRRVDVEDQEGGEDG